MVRSLLMWGLVAGLVAGLAAGAVAFVAAEPRIEDAIAIEASHAPAHERAEEARVSREGQRAGLFLACAVGGLSLGFLYSLIYAYALGRVGPGRPRRLAWALGGALLLAIVVLPALKYPANPPGVGDPQTITPRTLAYLALLACSLLALWAAARVFRAQRSRYSPARAALAGTAVYAAVVGVAYLLLPPVDEVPESFPESLLAEFRLASLAVQVTFWLVLAPLFGALAERATRHWRAGPA
jgi:hypothetical protein